MIQEFFFIYLPKLNPKLDRKYTFPIGLDPNGIWLGSKSTGSVIAIQIRFILMIQKKIFQSIYNIPAQLIKLKAYTF